MFRKLNPVVAILGAFLLVAAAGAGEEWGKTREFPASYGQTLELDLDAGGTIKVTGWDESKVSVTYTVGGRDSEYCRVELVDSPTGVKVISGFEERAGSHSASIDFDIKVPREFDLKLDSMGGSLELTGVEGDFRGETMGGALILHDVRGTARLKTMGGEITLTDSELDGSLETMGGEVLFRNVVGDVKGSSMGGNVKYHKVVRRDGSTGSPARVGGIDVTGDSVQISTMGGSIEIEDAPEGASLQTMGGNIHVSDASRFVDAKTMGGDILISSVDGWVKATTMGGDVDVTVVGSGGDITLTSMSGDVMLVLPAGFSAEFDLEIAFTKNSSQDYEISSDLGLKQSVTSEWDRTKGTPRKYIRAVGTVGGGEHKVKIRTVNGDIEIK